MSEKLKMSRIEHDDEFLWPIGQGVYLRGLMPDDSRWVDPTRRDEKSTHPYSYSEFFLYGDRATAKTATDALYSDRIWQWDREKADRCWSEHVGKRNWTNSGQKAHSAFMSAYLGKPVKVICLAEGCNVSNGYPYWIVWIKEQTDIRPAVAEA